MKLIIILLVAGLTGESLASGDATFADEKEPSRTRKGLYAKPKMVDNRNLFSPRMEYDEWTPLGRGDPLKNDPTYDYVPPVLERVHYWMEPSKRTPDPPVLNSGVLILGSSRTEPTHAIRVTTPKYHPAKEADSRLDTMSLLDPFLKLMDVSKFGLNLNPSTNNYYKPAVNQNRIHPVNYQRPPGPPHPFNGQRYQQPQALQRPPYTMLMPPPPPPPPTSSSVMTFATISTTTEVPRTQSYLTTTTTASQTTTTVVTTTAPTTKPEPNITTVYPTTVIANTENLYKPVAIGLPDENDAIRNDAESFDSVKKPVENKVKDYEYEYKNQQKRPPQEQYTVKSKDPHKHRPSYDDSKMTPPSKGVKYQSGSKWGADNRATTMRPVTTTRVTNILTTDPMFKHYKQPSEPIKGPFYLIIQGHSKVKTYGASKNPINGLLTSNEIREESDDRKNRYREFYEPQNKKRGKSLSLHDWSENHLRDEERKKKFGSVDTKTPAISELAMFDAEDGTLEDAFGKSEGGSSKKRYLVDDATSFETDAPSYRNRQLLSREEPDKPTVPTMITSNRPTTSGSAGPNLDIESFIALNDDYTPEDVVSLLLKEEGQGSGFGNFVVSLFGKSLNEEAR
ncbi:UNVERIFIED_CONTAM: hypothetical protein PYX00_009670 [Menopon gallinae]